MIGRMDQRITLQRATATPDGAGGVTQAWGDLATVWAAVEARTARESLSDGRVTAAYVARFTIYNRDVQETDRIIWNGETYNIRGVMRRGARELRLVIDAERGTA